MHKGKDLALLFSLFPFSAQAYAAMPSAALPIEPATPDEEFYRDEAIPSNQPTPSSRNIATETSRGSAVKTAPAAAKAGSSEDPDFGVEAQVEMVQDGFGGRFKIREYTASWFAFAQSVRYFQNEAEERRYERHYGALLGVEMHPWRTAFISPYLHLGLGWERYELESLAPKPKKPLDYALAEGAAGLEMRLGSFVSIAAQWSEAYYPNMREQLLLDKDGKGEEKRLATAQVLFKLRWDTAF